MVHSFTVFYQRRWIHSFHGACKCLIIGRTIQRLLVRHTLITQTHTHAVSGWPLLPLAPTTRRYSDLFLVQFLRFFFFHVVAAVVCVGPLLHGHIHGRRQFEFKCLLVAINVLLFAADEFRCCSMPNAKYLSFTAVWMARKLITFFCI